MTARDELAELIAVTEHPNLDPEWKDREDRSPVKFYSRKTADAILAAGYRRPRTITTVEELDSLPDMTVVRSRAGSIVNLVGGRAYIFGTEGSAPAASLALPATVLYEGAQS